MDDVGFSCSMCFFICNTQKRLAQHIVRRHRNDPNFIVQCCLNNCVYTTKSWNAYKLHISRRHKFENTFNFENDIEDEFIDIDENNVVNEEDIHKKRIFSVATYMLRLESEHKLSQKALNEIAGTTSVFLKQLIGSTKQHLALKLTENGVDDNILDGCFQSEQLFESFSSQYLRDQFYTQECRLLHSEAVHLGTKVKRTSNGLKTVHHYGRIVPFQKNIEALLNMPEVWHYVQNQHRSTDGLMRDYCDGSHIKSNPLFQQHPTALQILMSHDDFEIVNPLGSHVKKHKIAMFYFTLANIPPQHRSKLTAIQMLCLAKSKDLRMFGIDKLLNDFVCTVREMQSNGINITINGEAKQVYGTLVACPCDTLAAQWLGGFKEGVSFARQSCRTCTADKTSMKTKFMARDFPERSLNEHLHRCDQLETLSKVTKTYWSKIWGINRRSVLLDIDNFNPSVSFVHDPMHVLLEGIVPYEMALVLYHCIYTKKYFKLSWLNSQIKGYPYTYLDINSRPECIDKDDITVNNKIKQTSAAMMTLCFTMPHIIGFKIPDDDERWKNFIILLQIVILSTSPYVDEDSAGQLAQLVATHNYNFVKLYPKSSVIPKLHYCIHLAKQILVFGPLRHQWVMRYEAKHGFFKNMKWKCFRNILLTMAEKHQLYMCFKMLSSDGTLNENFIYEGDIIPEGSSVTFSNTYPDLLQHFQSVCARHSIETHLNQEVYLTDNVKVHGHTYKTGSFLLLTWPDCMPHFCCIDRILIVDNRKMFIVDILETVEFVSSVCSYKLNHTNNKKIIPYADLTNKWPLGGYYIDGNIYVVNRYCHFVEFI